MLLRLGTLFLVLLMQAAAQDAAVEHFEKKIRPVLASRCFACHSSSTSAPQGGLRLDSAQGIRKGGNSGAVVQPGDPEQSLIIRAIRRTDKKLQMPPGPALPPEVVADFELWVRNGAVLPADNVTTTSSRPALWSLQRPSLTTTPSVKNEKWARNEIDRFVLARLEAKSLEPSPEAERRTLIRRVSFDLTGLPPTAEETERFVADKSANAYEALIDRLLASPRYGERWGRHWLDVARYADSVNDSVNSGQRFPWSYTYRDWVIRSLNEDLPYDKFVLYQIAADRVPGVDPRHLAALGYLSLGREFPKSYPETVDDRIDAVTRGFLGMTVACARCHDHKFDPIPTKDYYSLYSVFSNIREPKKLPLLAKASLTSKDSIYQERLDRIEQDYQAYRQRRNAEMVAFFKTQIAEYLVAARDAETLSNPEIEDLVRERQLNQQVLARWRKFLRESKASGEPVFRQWHQAQGAALKPLATAYAARLTKCENSCDDPEREGLRAVMRGPKSPVDVPLDEFELIYTEGDSNNTRSILVRYGAMLAQAAYDGAAPRAMAVEDVPKPMPGHVFLRGNPNNPGAETPAHFLTCLGGSEQQAFRDGSGRLELAHAIIDPQNPVTARVIVNRVWMHHFGAGLVRTPSDFGFRGEPPTHPELLDYLAVKFVESGWSLKKLHRMILTSATYRQASGDNPAARAVDPENTLLWRMNRRRLEVESLRDAMLMAAGRLDTTTGGLPFTLTALPSVPRRSVYGFIERGRVPGLLSAFDFASPDQHAPMRYVTTVPQQALFFLNSPFVAEQSRALAARAANEQDKIATLYRYVFGRSPEPREVEAGQKFLSTQQPVKPAADSASAWEYGISDHDRFLPFPVFVTDRWQGGSVLPSPQFGKASLRATGGEPGDTTAVVLRWTSPVSGTLNIEGTLRHNQGAVPFGDGVRGRIVSSREGELASYVVNGSSAETKLSGLHVQKGDVVSFVVDCRKDPEGDGFSWAPILHVGEQTWNAKNDFAGPAPVALTAWERYAQVLLETNEFAFVD